MFDALTSQRPYKPALPLNEVMRMLAQGRGAHFDPKILDVFVPLAAELLREYAAGEESDLKGCLAKFEGRYFSRPSPVG